MLIASLVEARPEAVLAAARRAGEHADLLELRLDALDVAGVEALDDLLPRLDRPVVCTCRRTQDGGSFRGGDEERAALLRRAAAAGAAYLDVEEGSPAEALLDELDGVRFILSRHDLRGTPEDLQRIAARLVSRAGIALAKLVTTAGAPMDNLRMRALLQSPPSGAPLVAFCMGSMGVPSRLLALAWGSAATYGSAGAAAAAGQLPVAEMDRLYAVREATRATRLTAVVGAPLGHSLSPRVHNAAYRHLGIDFLYLPLESASADDAIRMAWQLGLHGFSVTLPHKVAVADLVDDLEPLARRVGAVNTVLCDEERMLGLNTDVTGGVAPLRRRGTVRGTPVAVIGAGGAARALVHGLAAEGAQVTVFNRTPERARALAREAGAAAAPLADLQRHPYRWLVNATPVGMEPAVRETPVPAAWLRGDLVYDLVYNPRRTRLLQEARARGIEVIEGLEMFVEQAAEQFEMFTDRTAPRRILREAAEAALEPAGADGDG